jgi:hypothetical protein
MRMRGWMLGGAWFVACLVMAGCPPAEVVGDDDTGEQPDDDDTSEQPDDDSAADDDDTGEQPDDDLVLWPPLDFGEITLGCDAEGEVQIINAGDRMVTLTGSELQPDDGQFTLIPEVDWPIIIAPGFDLELAVLYHPGTAGSHAMSIVLHTDHPDQPEVSRSVAGTGLSVGQQTDTLTQEANQSVDLLWVVDNSCSMAEEQTTLAAAADLFLDFLDAEGVDWHVGVVTTDNGTLRGGIITPAVPDPAGAFADAVGVGTAGSGTEQPLAFGYAGITSPLTDPGGANEGFVREEAGLALVILTDEDDQSGGGASDWINAFQALKSDPDRVVVSGITGLLGGCATAYAAPIISGVVAGTGGVESSICDEDWSGVLSAVAGLVTGPARVFGLSQPAVALSVTVTIDGEPQPEGWHYDELANAVEFDAAHVPLPESEITITYELVGECEDMEGAQLR